METIHCITLSQRNEIIKSCKTNENDILLLIYKKLG